MARAVIEVSPEGDLILKEVFSGVLFISECGEELSVCMRDSGFEFNYQGQWYSAQEGEVRRNEPPDEKKEVWHITRPDQNEEYGVWVGNYKCIKEGLTLEEAKKMISNHNTPDEKKEPETNVR